MVTALHILASVLVVVSAAMVAHRYFRLNMLSRPTLVGFFFLVFAAAHWLPSIAFLFDPALVKAPAYVWATTLTLLLVPVGGVLAQALMPQSLQAFDRFLAGAANQPPTPQDRLFVAGFGAMCLVILAAYMAIVPIYPLYHLIMGTAPTAELNEMRSNVMGPALDTPFAYLFGVARTHFMPFLFAMCFVSWTQFRSPAGRGMLLLFFATAFVYNSWSGAKTPVALLFLMAGLCTLLLTNRTRFLEALRSEAFQRFLARHRRRVVIGAVLLLAVVVAYPIFIFKFKAFGQNRPLWEIFYIGVFQRLFFKPAFLSYAQFEIFPHRYPFTHFMDISKLAAVLGQDYIHLSKLTAWELFGWDSHSPPAAVGNFYAQWGWPVVVGGAVAMGFVLQFSQALLVRFSPRRPVGIALYALLLFGSLRLSMASFHTVFLTEAIVPTLVFLFAWRWLRTVKW